MSDTELEALVKGLTGARWQRLFYESESHRNDLYSSALDGETIRAVSLLARTDRDALHRLLDLCIEKSGVASVPHASDGPVVQLLTLVLDDTAASP